MAALGGEEPAGPGQSAPRREATSPSSADDTHSADGTCEEPELSLVDAAWLDWPDDEDNGGSDSDGDDRG